LATVAAFPIPEVLQGINAFAIGARSVNPKAQVRVVWVNTGTTGQRSATGQRADGQGADVVTHHTDSTATVAAAEERADGRRLPLQHGQVRPERALAAVTHHWGDYYTRRAQAALDGTWKVEPVWGGIRERHESTSRPVEKLPKDWSMR